MVPRRVRPSRFADDLRDHSVSWVSAVPTLLDEACRRESTRRAHAPSASCALGARRPPRLPSELAQRFEDTFAAPLLEAYGMTEASHQMASNPLPPGERRVGSVGLATGTELAIVDEQWQEQGPWGLRRGDRPRTWRGGWLSQQLGGQRSLVP